MSRRQVDPAAVLAGDQFIDGGVDRGIFTADAGAGDSGTPVVAAHPESPEARAFAAIARRLIEAGAA